MLTTIVNCQITASLLRAVVFGIIAVSITAVNAGDNSFENYVARSGKFGLGGGSLTFGPHKQLKRYVNDSGFYGQAIFVGGMFCISYSRAKLLLKEEHAASLGIVDREATMSSVNLSLNFPIPIVTKKNFTLAPTITFPFIGGWHKFKVSDEAYKKLGDTNLTRLKNNALKYGNHIAGIGLSATLFKHVNFQASYSVQYIFEDWKWWYLFTSGIDGLAQDQIETFTNFRLGANIVF